MDTDEPQEKRSAFNKALDVPRDVFRSTVMAIKDFNFIQIHYIYFIGASLFSGLIFWGAATPFGSVSFTDSLFLTSKYLYPPINAVELTSQKPAR